MQYYTIASSNLFVGECLEIAVQYSLNLGFDIIDKNQSLLEKDKNVIFFNFNFLNVLLILNIGFL